MNYPHDCWYVAATSAEVGGGFTTRRIVDTSIVLFRLSDGSIAALEDRCAHRPYPLSAGHREGDLVVCGYHGCTYDATGRCVRIPSQDTPPAGALVRSFPVVERGPFIWVWTGTPGGERLRPPPSTPWLEEDGWSSVGERREVAASLMLLHEHYLDLTNVFAMHPEMVPPGIEALPPLEEVEVSEVSVSYRRELPKAPLATWEAQISGLNTVESFGRVETGAFVTPGLHKQTYAITNSRGAEVELVRTHGFTPQSSGMTHVFLQISWRGASVSPDAGTQLAAVFHEMANRDIVVLETVQRCLDEDHGDTAPRRYFNVKADRAAVRARRILASMVEDERGL